MELDVVFENVDKNKKKWVEMVSAKLGSSTHSEDIYQNCNLRILEAIISGRLRIESIVNDNHINYCYYYKTLMTDVYNHIRGIKGVMVEVQDWMVTDEDIKEDINIQPILSLNVKDIDIVIQNKYKSIPLEIIAMNRGVSYRNIQTRNKQALTEIRLLLNGQVN